MTTNSFDDLLATLASCGVNSDDPGEILNWILDTFEFDPPKWIKLEDDYIITDFQWKASTLDGLRVDCGSWQWIVFDSSERAGQAARQYWKDLAEFDADEFACLIGAETLIAWGLGRRGGPGTTKVSSLEEWFGLWLQTPEEHFATYDGEEKEIETSNGPMVAYRLN